MRPVFRSSGDLLADRRYRYGVASADEADYSAAAELFEQSLEIAPSWTDAWLALGLARRNGGDATGAREAFARCLEIDHDDTLGAELELARLDGVPIASAPRAYVTALFDAYAHGFDAALTGLGYRAPELIANAIAGRRYARALDLGCGAGLSGAALRPHVDRLEGIDLSAAMISRAREKELYDALECASIEERLARDDGPFDLIVAADVFCYLGDLMAPLIAIARRLDNAGVAAFTVEKSEGPDFSLQETRRFAHSESYVRGVAKICGLKLQSLEHATLRQDRAEAVRGIVLAFLRG